ncbi:hypothetical protein COU60_03415 [Candidatus Pacearchaeota archaeon CG10_big_fil_rev_8_21_14_0_10_34_76]|nr:MAG: hypothetical protein COU60_03415 [Candidatus Pacearchaeota archaeon CG10_big_fil_rev_8_21_14_0_10_34_76]
MKKYDVISFGSGLVDAFIYTDIVEGSGKLCIPSGTKVLVDKVNFSVGGGGINTSVCISKIGLKSGFLGKIGHGYNSKIILRELKKANVDFLGVNGKEHAGYSFILESKSHHRTILTYKGASNLLKYDEIKLGKMNSKWVHISSLAGDSFASQKKFVDFAKRNGMKVSFNPSSYQIRKGIEPLRKMLRNTDFLSLNMEEAEMLVGKNNIYKKIHELGPSIVCITDGARPGYVSDGIYVYKYSPKKVDVKEKTGAGDVFSSTFIAGLIKTGDIKESIKAAVINSASLVSTPGSRKGLLSWKEIKGKSDKENIIIKRVNLK